MFKKLLEKAEAANLKAALQSGTLVCPSCGAKPAIKPAAIPSGSSEVIACSHCGAKASAFEWSAASSHAASATTAETPPANTRITRSTDAGGPVIWDIPASGRSGGLFIFGILWCSITAAVSGVFLLGDGEFKSNHGIPLQLLLILFFGIFWAIGLGMLYAGCRNRYAKHRLTADNAAVTLRRELFGKAKEKSLPAESITSIAQVAFYQQNYEPVYGIEIKGSRGKLRFGSVLTDEEKAWLVADLRRVVLGPSTTATAATVDALRTRQSYFSFPLSKASHNLWPLAIMLTLIGTGFVCVGISFIDLDTGYAEKDTPRAARLFDMVFNLMTGAFRIIWLTMSGAMATAGLALGLWLNKTRNQETRIEASDSEVAIRTSRQGRVLTERVFPRASVTDIRASVSGTSNGKTMKRLELIVGNRVEILSRWIDGDKADELVQSIRQAL